MITENLSLEMKKQKRVKRLCSASIDYRLYGF